MSGTIESPPQFYPKMDTYIYYNRANEYNQFKWTDKFGPQTNIEEIHQFIRQEFASYLQNEYFIQFTKPRTEERIILNQSILDSNDNPFKNIALIEDPLDLFNNSIFLYVIDYFPHNIQIQEQQTTTTSSSIPSFQFSNTEIELIHESQVHEESLPNANATNIRTQNFGDLPFVEFTDEPNASAINNVVTDHNRAVNSTHLGTTDPPPSNAPTTSENSNARPPLDEADRPYFTNDVKPVQKPIFISDQFNQRNLKKKNGYVTYVQGKKEKNQSRTSVLPRIHLMKRWRKKNIRLLIYVVYQKKLPNGTISWIKHPDKKFLPAGYKRDTTAVNPIAIPFNKMKPSGKGDFKLAIKMVTKWDKSTDAEEEEIHHMDEDLAQDLHSVMDFDTSKYDPKTPRLFGMIEQNGNIVQGTNFLSDFIRTTYNAKRSKKSQ